MDPVFVQWLLYAGMGSAIAFGAHFFSREATTKRALRRAHRTCVSQARDGQLVKLVGRVHFLGNPLVAPLTSRRCAYYAVWSVGDPGTPAATMPPCNESGQDFLLQDATGTALIHLTNADVVVERDGQYQATMGMPPHLAQFLHTYARGSQGRVQNPFDFREGVLEEGEQVAVIGRCTWQLDPRGSTDTSVINYRDPPKILVVQPPPNGKVLVSDDPTIAIA